MFMKGEKEGWSGFPNDPEWQRSWRVFCYIAEAVQQIERFGYSQISVEQVDSPKFRKVNLVVFKYKSDGQTQEGDRELLKDGDGSYALALTEDDRVVFLLQVRPGLENSFQIEFPAGGFDKEREEAKINVIDELRAEAGGVGREPILLFEGPVLAGRSPQVTHGYLIEKVELNLEQRLEQGEMIIPFTVLLEDAMSFVHMILTNRGNENLKGLEVDPKIVTTLTMAAMHYYQNGNLEMAKRFFAFQ